MYEITCIVSYTYEIIEMNETVKNNIVCWYDRVKIQYFYFDFYECSVYLVVLLIILKNTGHTKKVFW